jgi:hypothetical protein
MSFDISHLSLVQESACSLFRKGTCAPRGRTSPLSKQYALGRASCFSRVLKSAMANEKCQMRYGKLIFLSLH